MKGDFSHWQFDPFENFTGVLQQQGRVLLDRDWNEATRIDQHWRDHAGQDVIGAGFAAVPVGAPDGFAVVEAQVTGVAPDQRIELQLRPGHLWADGILCHLAPGTPGSSDPVMRVADYLQPPVDTSPGSVATVGPGVRDAVVLEVSREELNAFQVPERLLEPALGGPDTTERVHLRLAFRLFRLEPGETCLSILGDLRDDVSAKGRLTVRLQPTAAVGGDCPVVAGGGYSGLEHHLYRVEIAAVAAAQPPSFKWSQFNGGLVGRGRLLAAPDRLVITANHAAILNSGLSTFYLEAIGFDADRGTWVPTLGADVTLNNGELIVGTIRFGSFSAGMETVFFRLWNGIEPIADFTDAVNPVELLDGIQLVFDPVAANDYAPGDFWTFPVRAGEITNPAVLLDDRPPQGPRHHRVPLAEIHWGPPGDPVVPPEIEDCRRRFRPLTRLDTCCTVRVGDGVTSLGDFTSVQAAVNALPPEGGTVCILPGVYPGTVVLNNRQGITLSGCGPRTRLVAPPGLDAVDAVITIRGGSRITLESFAVEASPVGRGILAVGRNPDGPQEQLAQGPVDGLALLGLHVLGTNRAAVRAEFVDNLVMRDCVVRMADTTCHEHACVIGADDAVIEHNLIEVALRDGAGAGAAPALTFLPGGFSRGGLHLLGGCQRVQVIDNRIRGGSGNGITLGSLVWYFEDGDEPVPPGQEPEPPEPDPCDPGRPVDFVLPERVAEIGDGLRIRLRPGLPLYDVRVERNQILAMGSNGIGVVGFFDLSGTDEFITVVNLLVIGNEIRGCLRRGVTPPPESLEGFIGYGAIALADVENLVVQDNLLVDNGANHLDPVCGVYVLHGEGVDISRNRILNNGARTEEPPSDAARGARGGIFIRFTTAPTVDVLIRRTPVPQQNGVPAAKIHGNTVSAPLGQALSLRGIGPMTIQGNQFTTQNAAPLSVAPEAFAAATVMIVNLGVSNEFYSQILQFAALGASDGIARENLKADLRRKAGGGGPGLDDAEVGRLLANGQVLFCDNQVNLDLVATGLGIAFSSVLILSTDDIGFHDNQCEANLVDDFVFVHTLLFSFSLRATGNRWKEGIVNAGLSAFTLSFIMNTTTDNQATHCLVIRSVLPAIVDDRNLVLLDALLSGDRSFCDPWNEFLPNLSSNRG